MTSDDRERSGSIDGATADREAVLEGGSEDLDDEEEFDDEELDDDDEEEFDDEELDDEELDDDDDLDDDDLDDEDGEEDEHLGNGVGYMHAGEADYEPGDVNTISGPAARRGEPAAGRGDTAVAVLEYLARSMADDPDAVVIREEDRRGSTILRLHVAPHDMGRVIGRRGRTAQAIRTLVAVAGASDGAQTLVDIADD